MTRDTNHSYAWLIWHDIWMNRVVYMNDMTRVNRICPLTEEIILQIFESPDHYTNPVRSFQCRGVCLPTWKFCWKSWGLPWYRVWYVRGLPWKLVGNFGSRNYFQYDLLRAWAMAWIVSHIWMTWLETRPIHMHDSSDLTYEWIVSRIRMAWLVLRIWMTYMNGAYEWRIWMTYMNDMTRVVYMNDIYEWRIWMTWPVSRIWMIYMNGVYEWRIWMAYMNDVYEWRIWMTYINGVYEWRIWMAYMNDVYKWRIRRTWLDESCRVYEWHDSIHEPFILIHMHDSFDMTWVMSKESRHVYEWVVSIHDSSYVFICIHMYVFICMHMYSYVWTHCSLYMTHSIIVKTIMCSYIWIHMHTYENISIHMYEHTKVNTWLIAYMTHLIAYVNGACPASDAYVFMYSRLECVHTYEYICIHTNTYLFICMNTL